jgi:hypothetical protein
MRLKAGIKTFGAAIKKTPALRKRNLDNTIHIDRINKVEVLCYGNSRVSGICLELLVGEKWDAMGEFKAIVEEFEDEWGLLFYAKEFITLKTKI